MARFGRATTDACVSCNNLPSQLDAVLKYIEGQREHHRNRTFQEEYRALLRNTASISMSVTRGIETLNRAFGAKIV